MNKIFSHKTIAMFVVLFLLSCASSPDSYKCCDEKKVPPTVTEQKENFNFSKKEMANSMVLIKGAIYDGETRSFGYTGSGVVVAHDDISTLVLTAAHVCKVPGYIMDSIKEKSEAPDMVKQKLSVVDRTEMEHAAMAYVAAVNFDACLIQIPKIYVKETSFSVVAPTIGDAIFNISAPYGHYSKNLAPMFKGYYSGSAAREKGMVDIYSISVDVGSSGSPLLNSSGDIVGIVSAIRRNFHHLTISPTWEQIKQFMEAGTVVTTKQFINYREYAEIVGKAAGAKASRESESDAGIAQ